MTYLPHVDLPTEWKEVRKSSRVRGSQTLFGRKISVIALGFVRLYPLGSSGVWLITDEFPVRLRWGRLVSHFFFFLFRGSGLHSRSTTDDSFTYLSSVHMLVGQRGTCTTEFGLRSDGNTGPLAFPSALLQRRKVRRLELIGQVPSRDLP